MEHKWARSKCIKESYYEHIAELYFLETSGNMLDYYTWRKKPRTNHYMSYLTKHQLDASDLSQADTPLQVTTPTTIASRLPSSPKPETSGTSIATSQNVVLAAPITQTGKTHFNFDTVFIPDLFTRIYSNVFAGCKIRKINFTSHYSSR